MMTAESGDKCVSVFSYFTDIYSEPDQLKLLNSFTEYLMGRHGLLVLCMILQTDPT